VDIVAFSIRLRYVKRFTTDINTDPSRVTPLLEQLNNERDRETSRTNTEIDKAKGTSTPREGESLLNDKLRLRTWHQNGGRNSERKPPKLALPGYIRDRLPSLSPFDERAEMSDDLRLTKSGGIYD
jgi:hypothetical protein